MFARASFHLIDCPEGCPEIVACPVKILCPLEPVTYPESDKVAVVKLLPPSLLIEAIISVFNVGVATFSSNTTILLVVGTLPAAKAVDTIVVVDVTCGSAVPVKNTYPSSQSPPPAALPSFVPA